MLERSDWNKRVKDQLNLLIDEFKNHGEYVVFDHDHSTSIFDEEHQFMIYQIQRMAFGFSPLELESSFCSLPDPDGILEDIAVAYRFLYEHYGPFSAKGVDEELLEQLWMEDMWKEFATKFRYIRDHYWDHGGFLYFAYRLTAEEIYQIAYASHMLFQFIDTDLVVWKSPDIISKFGQVEYSWHKGVSVTENIKELQKSFKDNGIDVWIVSASQVDTVLAAVDAFGLHDHVKGVIGICYQKDEDGRYLCKLNDEAGCYFAVEDGWKEGNIAIGCQPEGVGKADVIENVLYPLYKKGPLAGFMDSSGDFSFCSEFTSMKLVVCFNRCLMGPGEGGALIAETAVYQREVLHYDLHAAMKNGDTLYLLQGRNENGKRTLRDSEASIRLFEKEERLFAYEENEKQLSYFKEKHLSTSEILNIFSIKKTANDPNNPLGFSYGFLEEYMGYHSR